MVFYEELDSTNTVAQALAKEGAKEGTMVIAESQTEGRGRMGRQWYSPRGLNLYFSIILRPSCEIRTVSWLGMAAAVAVARSIENHTGLTAQVKWPNDIQVNQKKIAGLLIEQAIRGRELEFIVLGLGINLNMTQGDFPPELKDKASSLRVEGGGNVNRRVFLKELLSNLEACYRQLLQSFLKDIREEYLGRFELLGQAIHINTEKGKVFGTATGLTEDGALLLKQPGGQELVIHSGDISGVV